MDIHWRNSQKPVRFFFMDARAFIGILAYLVHARVWVMVFALVSLVVFWSFERRGLSFASAMRAIRSWFIGRWRPANSRRGARYTIDNNCV